jgi:hypothetical protein
MKANYKGMKNQRGSIVAGLLILVAIIGVIGAYMMSGNTNASSASSSTGGVMGAAIQTDGNAIQQTAQTLIVNGSAASALTFIPGGVGVSNILNPTTGIQLPMVNGNAVTNSTFPNGAWIYNPTGFIGNTIGTAAADQAAIVLGVKDGVCQQINTRLYGSTAIPASGFSPATWATGATALAPTSTGATSLLAAGVASGWMAGCVTTTSGTDNNVYFQIVQAN